MASQVLFDTISYRLEVLDDAAEVSIDKLHLVVLVLYDRLLLLREVHLILIALVHLELHAAVQLLRVPFELFYLLHVRVERG